MEPYTEVAFDAAVGEGETRTFYTEDLKYVIARLELLKFEFSRHYGANPNVVNGVTVFFKEKSEAEDDVETPGPSSRKKSRKVVAPEGAASTDEKKKRP